MGLPAVSISSYKWYQTEIAIAACTISKPNQHVLGYRLSYLEDFTPTRQTDGSVSSGPLAAALLPKPMRQSASGSDPALQGQGERDMDEMTLNPRLSL